MNTNRIVTMLIRRVMGMVINKGIDASADHLAKRGPPGSTSSDQTAQTKKRLRQTARLARRLGRF